MSQISPPVGNKLSCSTPLATTGGTPQGFAVASPKGRLTDLEIWNRQAKLSKVFSSSTVFILPNGAKRSPDAAWVKLERWEALTLEQRKKFPPLVPDFAIELRFETDRLAPIQAKMNEYIENGLRLGWLINPVLSLSENNNLRQILRL